MRAVEEQRVAAALAQLVAEHGTAPLSDPVTLRALLHDVLGADAPQLRREIKLLTDAAAEGVPATLAASGPSVFPISQSLTSKLTRLGMDEDAAQFAVKAWSTSLGNAAAQDPTHLTVQQPGWNQNTGPQPGWNQNAGPHTGWNQNAGPHTGWNQTVVGPDPRTGHSTPPAPPKSRRGVIIALAAAGAVLIAGAGVGIAVLGGGDDELYGTGEDGIEELLSLLPDRVELDGTTVPGTKALDQLKEDCGVAEPPIRASASYLYGQGPQGTGAFAQADAFPSADAAVAYIAEVRAKLLECTPFANPEENFPNEVATVRLDTDFAGPGVRYFIGRDLGVSPDPQLPDDVVIYQAYRAIQVGNVVATLLVDTPNAVVPRAALEDLEEWTTGVHSRMLTMVYA